MALEMTRVDRQHEREEDVIDLSLVNPIFKKTNNVATGNTVQEIRRNKVRRLSKVMNARETVDAVDMQEEKDEEGQGEEKENVELDIEILKDETNGRRYSYNNRTGESLWVDPEVIETREGGEEHGGETEENEEELVFDIDEATGRRYSYNQATGTSLWVD
jgi:hypothetical protein